MEKDRVEKNREWTFEQPTEEGHYWLEKGLGETEIVKVKKNAWEKLCASFTDMTVPTELSFLKGLRWCGPITPPPIKLIKEEINEDSHS